MTIWKPADDDPEWHIIDGDQTHWRSTPYSLIDNEDNTEIITYKEETRRTPNRLTWIDKVINRLKQILRLSNKQTATNYKKSNGQDAAHNNPKPFP